MYALTLLELLWRLLPQVSCPWPGSSLALPPRPTWCSASPRSATQCAAFVLARKSGFLPNPGQTALEGLQQQCGRNWGMWGPASVWPRRCYPDSQALSRIANGCDSSIADRPEVGSAPAGLFCTAAPSTWPSTPVLLQAVLALCAGCFCM